MGTDLERESGNWLSDTNQLFSKKGANRLECLVNQTPRSSHWVFPGGKNWKMPRWKYLLVKPRLLPY